MRHTVKDIFAQLDEVCRAIVKAARDADQRVTKASASSAQPEFEALLGGLVISGENAYANHVAHGMAKLRARQ
jgi:hypothetical protein